MLIFTGDLPEFPLQMDRPISQKPSPSPRSHPPPPSARCLGVHECVLPTDLPELIKSPLRTGSFTCGFLWGPESLSTCSALTGARIPSPPPRSPQMSFRFAGGGGHGAPAAPNTAVEGEGPSGRAGLQMALHSSPLLSKLADSSTSWGKQLLCPWWPVAATLFCQDPTCSLSVFHVVLSVDGAFLAAKPPRLSPVFLQSFPFRWGLLGSGRTARKEAVSSQAEFMFLKHVFLRLNR